MEKYNLEQTGQEVQNILDNATPQSELTAETERAQEAERLLGEGIQKNATDIDSIEGKIPSAATSENKLTDKEYVDGQVDDEKNRAQGVEGTLQDNIDAEETRAKAAERQNADDIDALEAVVPSGATSENKLATESYVNDAVATSSVTFRGTFNLVSDLHLTLEATHANIATALAAAIATADNNDFAFVLIPTDADTPTVIGSIERYKFNGTDWAYEYTLNNSGFTQAQWDAINSGITSNDVTKLAALPTNAQLTTLLNGKQDTLTFDNVPTENSLNPVKSGGVYSAIKDEETRAKAAEKANADDIDAIEEKIPSSASSSNQLATASDVDSLSAAIEAILLLIPTAASSLNQLADKAFVNSSIATATATFRGTFNLVNDLHLTLAATHAQVGNALAVAISDENNNDYCFVQIPTTVTSPTEIAQTDRYKFNGSTWEYEYTLNNSGFTSAQWTAINSGITEALVTKLSALPTNTELTTALGVLTSSITTINQKIPSAASQANQLVDTAAMESYIVQVLDVLTASFNVTSSDGHVTVQISQVDGKITSFALTTIDIASAASLSLVEGRVTTAEGNISTNSADIAILQDAYAALTQSAMVIVRPTDTWPVASPATSIIYRVVDRVNTPPQYYSDYMWNGTAMVLMATYNNAIDDVPTPGSNNLVKSGGVQNELALGAVYDVSAKNPTGGPNNDGKFTLEYILDQNNVNTLIPTAYRKGGMSIKFVHSSDNKYVQARCMAQNFTTDITQWQGVDDEPTAGSDNLVKSGGVYNSVGAFSETIDLSETVQTELTNQMVLLWTVDTQLNTDDEYEVSVLGTFSKTMVRIYANNVPNGLVYQDNTGAKAKLIARQPITKLFYYANCTSVGDAICTLNYVIPASGLAKEVEKSIKLLDNQYLLHCIAGGIGPSFNDWSVNAASLFTFEGDSFTALTSSTRTKPDIKRSINCKAGKKYYVLCELDVSALHESGVILKFRGIKVYDIEAHIGKNIILFDATVADDTTNLWYLQFSPNTYEGGDAVITAELLYFSIIETDSDVSSLSVQILEDATVNDLYVPKYTASKPVGGKWVALGDSLTAQKKYIPNTELQLGFNSVVNLGVGGKKASGNDGMWKPAYLSQIPSDARLITIMCGTNDWAQSVTIGDIESTDTNEYCGALNAIIDYVSENYPKIRFVIMCPPIGVYPNRQGWSAPWIDNINGNSMMDFAEAAYKVASNRGIPCARVGQSVGWNDKNISTFIAFDGAYLHPNEDGGLRISEVLIGFLRNIL